MPSTGTASSRVRPRRIPLAFWPTFDECAKKKLHMSLINDHKFEVRKFPFRKYIESLSAIYGSYLNFELLILRMDFLSHKEYVNSLVGERFT